MFKSSFLRFLAIPLIWAGSLSAMSITQEDIQRQFIEAIKKNRVADTAFFLDQGALVDEPDLEGKTALDYLAQLHEKGQELRELLQERYPYIDIPRQTQAPEPSVQAPEPVRTDAPKADPVQAPSLRAFFSTQLAQAGRLIQQGASAAQDLIAPSTRSESKSVPVTDLISAVAPHSLTHLFLEHPQLFQRCTASLQRDIGRTIAQKLLHESPIKHFLREKIKSRNYCLFMLTDNYNPQFNPIDGTLLTTSLDGGARLWDPTKGRCLRVFKRENPIENARFTPAGDKLITMAQRNISILTIPHGVCLRSLDGSENALNNLETCFSSSGQKMVLSHKDKKSFDLVDIRSGKLLLTCKGHENPGESKIDDLGERALLIEKGIVKLLDATSGACIHSFKDYVSWEDSAYIKVSDKFYTYDDNGDSKEWQAGDFGGALHKEQKHISWIKFAGFCASGTRVVTQSEKGIVKLWDALSGTCVCQLPVKPLALVLGPVDRFITISSEGVVTIWDAASGNSLKVIDGNYLGINRVSFSSSGDKLLMHQKSGTIKVFELTTGDCLFTIDDPAMENVIFDPTSTFIIGTEKYSGLKSVRVKIWHILSRECLYNTTAQFAQDLGRGNLKWLCPYVRSNSTGDKIAVSLRASLELSYNNYQQVATTMVWDMKRLVSLLNWLEKECSFEQALLLTCIYENLVALTLLEKRCPTIPYWKQLWKRRFDFNKCPHLQVHYDTMPVEVQAILENYVIKSGQQ